MGGDNQGSDVTPMSVLSKMLGRCPEAVVRFGTVEARCLLDMGSEVLLVTETFYRENLQLLGTGTSDIPWLRIMAVNGLDIPYVGYM